MCVCVCERWGTHPDFPEMMEAELLGPDAYHTPTVEEDDGYGYEVEHGFGAEVEAFLGVPEGVDADGLGCDAD